MDLDAIASVLTVRLDHAAHLLRDEALEAVNGAIDFDLIS
jgi:hypothetical protein